MTPEEKSLLERTYKIAEENNTILRGIRRSNRLSAAFKIFYWLVIIGLSVGALYFIQPYIDSAMDMVNQAQKTIKNINGTVDQAQSTLNQVSNQFGK